MLFLVILLSQGPLHTASTTIPKTKSTIPGAKNSTTNMDNITIEVQIRGLNPRTKSAVLSESAKQDHTTASGLVKKENARGPGSAEKQNATISGFGEKVVEYEYWQPKEDHNNVSSVSVSSNSNSSKSDNGNVDSNEHV